MTRSMTARSTAPHADSRSSAVVSIVRSASNRLTRGARDEGFTIAEVVVAMTLFVIISMSTLTAMITMVQVTSITQRRVTAANLARQEVERLRGENLSVSQLDAAPLTPSVAGTTYTVTPTMNPLASDPCAPGSTRQVTVVVSWSGTTARSVRYDTVLSC